MAKKDKSKKKKSKNRDPRSEKSSKKVKGGATKKGKAKKKKTVAAPKPVKTGKGANPLELGTALVQMVREGKFEPNDALWSPKFSSIEGHGVAMEWAGKKAVRAKNSGWYEQNTIHGVTVEGPFVGATGFAVKFLMDIEEKGTGSRKTMQEVGVYTIKNGKIVREEFMYSMS